MSYADIEVNRKHYRERYRDLRRRGLCGQCAKIKTTKALCMFCREVRNAARKGNRRPQPREPRIARYWRLRGKGLCTACGLPGEGKSRCETCRGKEKLQQAGKRTARMRLLRALEKELAQVLTP